MEGRGTLTMPAGHTRAEIGLARDLAHELELGELHVFWSTGAGSTPDPGPAAPAVLRALSALGSAIGWLAGVAEGRPRRA